MKDLLSGAVVKDFYPICDYWQLITDGPIVTINNPIVIFYQNKSYFPHEIEKEFVSGKKITSETYVENESYEIFLQNELRIKISLCPDDYVCPEAICISNSRSGGFVVF